MSSYSDLLVISYFYFDLFYLSLDCLQRTTTHMVLGMFVPV